MTQELTEQNAALEAALLLYVNAALTFIFVMSGILYLMLDDQF